MFHAFAMGLAALLAAGPVSTLSLEACAARARPGLAEGRVAAELAELDAELAATRGLLREGPELAALLGRRSAAGEADGDFGLDADLPLASRASRRARQELAARLSAEGPLLLAAARLEDRREWTAAYLVLFGAQQRRALLASQATLLEAFSRLTAERIAAGAAAAYEGVWVEKEVGLARGELALAAAAERRAWADLRLFIELPERPLPRLERPAFELPATATKEPPEPALAGTALAGAGLRAEAQIAGARREWSRERELSRWSLAASLAREGEESVATFGWRWRMPLPGERAALHARSNAAASRDERSVTRRLQELSARGAESRALLAAFGEMPERDEDQEAASELLWGAVEARVREGKDTPAAALALRRAAVAASLAELELDERRLAAQAELYFLNQEMAQ